MMAHFISRVIQSVPPRDSGWLLSISGSRTGERSHPLPRGGTDLMACVCDRTICWLEYGAFLNQKSTLERALCVSGPIAQSVEQLAFNQWVAGSSPARLTTKINNNRNCLPRSMPMPGRVSTKKVRLNYAEQRWRFTGTTELVCEGATVLAILSFEGLNGSCRSRRDLPPLPRRV
jgi:hypothetical protein